MVGQSSKYHIHVDAVCPRVEMSVASVPSDMHLAKLESTVPRSNPESFSNFDIIGVNETGDVSNSDDIKPIDINTADMQSSVILPTI